MYAKGKSMNDIIKTILISMLVALGTAYVTTHTVLNSLIYSNQDKIKELKQIRDQLSSELNKLGKVQEILMEKDRKKKENRNR